MSSIFGKKFDYVPCRDIMMIEVDFLEKESIDGYEIVTEQYSYEWYKNNEFMVLLVEWLLSKGQTEFKEFFREFIYIPNLEKYSIEDAKVTIINEDREVYRLRLK